MMNLPFFQSLKGRLSLFLILGNFLIILLATTCLAGLVQSETNHQFEAQLQNQVKRITASLTSPVWEFDFNQITEIIQSEMAESALVGLALNSTQKEERKIFKKNSGEKLLVSDFYPDVRKEFPASVLVANDNLYRGNIFLGEVTYFFNTDSMRTVQTSITVTALVFALVFGLANVLLIFWGLKIFLQTPLRKLHLGVQSFAVNISQRINLPARDEIGAVAVEFDKMADRLASSFEYQENLLAELSRLKNFMAQIIESNTSALVALDRQGHILHWNKAAEDLARLSRQQVLGSCLWEVVPSLNRYRERAESVLVSGRPALLSGERLNPDSDRYFNLHFHPVNTGTDPGLVVKVDEITLQVRQEAQRSQTSKMDSFAEAASKLAHDLNNLSGGLSGSASVLRQLRAASQPINPADLATVIKALDFTVNQADSLAQKLAGLGPQSHQGFKEIDLAQLVKDVLARFSLEKTDGFQIQAFFPDSPCPVKGDAEALANVFDNLLQNAPDAISSLKKAPQRQTGTINLSIDILENDEYFSEYHPEAEAPVYFVLTISDDGIGIPKENLARIFDPFFTTKSQRRHRGMGLAVAYGILRSHEAFLDVYSEPGTGTAFTIYFPANAPDRELSGQESQTRQEHLQGTRILLADDDTYLLEMGRKILEASGCLVTACADGQAAWEAFASAAEEFDLAIIDWTMPRLTGPELVDKFLRDRPGFRILMASGFPSETRIYPLMAKGVRGFIKKPWSAQDLTSKVYQCLAGS